MQNDWPYTSKMRVIEQFDGDGDAVWEQGDAIVKLAYKMEFAAETLRTLNGGEDGQQGKSVDALREKVGDADDTLALAAELYKPLGKALKYYGEEVRTTIKPQVDGAYETAWDRWTEYDKLPGDKDGRDYFLGIGKPDEGSAEQDEHEQEDLAKRQAWTEWTTAQNNYDGAYDNWKGVWDKAVRDIDDGFSDDLKDSKWEDFKQVLNFALEVLKWAGLIFGVAALIIGGPIIAAIAAAIAVASLIITLALAFDGDKSWGDVAWAAVDVLPFGKVGKLFQRGQKMDFVNEATKNFKFVKFNGTPNPKKWGLGEVYSDGWKGLKELPSKGFQGPNKNRTDIVHSLLTGKNQAGWDKIITDNFQSANMPKHMSIEAWNQELAIRNASATWETIHSGAGHVFKVEGWHNTIENQVTGGDEESWKNSNPVTKLIW